MIKAGIHKLLKRLKSDTRGNILLIAGAGMTVLVGGAGLGVDTVNWYLWKRQMQQAVDTSATAGALSLAQGHGYLSSATSELARTANNAYVIERISNPPTTGAFAGRNDAVEVIATTSMTLPFSSLFMNRAPVIRTRAVAGAVAIGEPCIRALARSGTGIEVIGSALVNLGCPVSSNSPGGVSIDINGSSYLNSDLIMSVGGVDYATRNIPEDATVMTYGLPVEDPFKNRSLVIPNNGCVLTNHRVGSNREATLGPCEYRGGLTIQGTANLKDGIYVINGGELKINSGAKVRMATGATGVTFILTGPTSTQIATVSINGGADIDIVATTRELNANFAGILFYQNPLGVGTQHTINGGAHVNLEGAIYMPTGDLSYTGGASQSAQCLLIVTERVRFAGNNTIANNCNDDLDRIDSSARIVRVVE